MEAEIDDREVDALYRLTPEDFVTARDSLARAMRSGGDRDTAELVKALRRPSVGAWLVNQLAREHDDELDELLETGAVLRETQAAVLAGQADGAQLQALTAARRQQIDGLIAAARQLALAADRKNPPLDAVDSTLVAATADAGAADAVRSGRLVKELSYSGFGLSDDLADVVAPPLRVVRKKAPSDKPAKAESKGSSAKPAPAKSGRGGKVVVEEPKRDPAAEKRAAAEEAARQGVLAAQTAVHEALGAADDAQRAFDAVSDDVARAEGDEERLTAELAAVRERLTAAREQQRAARATARSAHAEAEKARTALVRAQQKLDHIR